MTKNQKDPATNESVSIDWSKVKPEDIPRNLLDRHPHVRGLQAKARQLEQDLQAVYVALTKFGNVASAIHSIIEPLTDVNLVAISSLSHEGKQILGLTPRMPQEDSS